MTQKTVTQILASAVATSGTFTVTYPSGTNAAWFQKGVGHQIAALGKTFSSPEDFGITAFGNASCIALSIALRIGWVASPPDLSGRSGSGFAAFGFLV